MGFHLGLREGRDFGSLQAELRTVRRIRGVSSPSRGREVAGGFGRVYQTLNSDRHNPLGYSRRIPGGPGGPLFLEERKHVRNTLDWPCKCLLLISGGHLVSLE